MSMTIEDFKAAFQAGSADNDGSAPAVAGRSVGRDSLDQMRGETESSGSDGTQTSLLSPGQQIVRAAGGNLAAALRIPANKNSVLLWLKSISSDVTEETKDDVSAVFDASVLTDLPVLEAFLKTTSRSRSEIQSLPAFGVMPKFAANKLLDKYRPDAETERQKQVAADKDTGELFLSSGYRLINPLLAAFDALNVDPLSHRDSGFSYKSFETDLLEKWKKIAVARRYSDEGAVESWDLKKMKGVYADITAIERSWENFDVPEIPGGVVSRGDSVEMYTAYPLLDPYKNDYPDGEVSVSGTIIWPGIMSTTVGDPKSHSFISNKTMIWRFSVGVTNAGRSIGSNNKSEQEVTFPIGTKIVLQKLIVRRKDKTIRQEEFGSMAEVIGLATLV